MKQFNMLLVLLMLVLMSITANADSSLLLEYDGGTHVYSGNTYDLVVRNKPVYSDMSPIIFNDRALVPVREVCEAIGAQVNYTNDTQTVEIVGDDTYIRLKINDNTAVVNGSKTAIPDNVVPKLISKVGGNTKTMVPVRFISETIGLDVDFDSDKGTILVDSSGSELATIKPISTPTPTAEPTPAVTAAPTAAPTVTPVVEKTIINNLSYEMTSSNKITVTVKADKALDVSYFTLQEPERLVVDFAGAKAELSEMNYTVAKGGINTIRVGITDERTRLVIDADKIVSYDVNKSGKTVKITLEAKATQTQATTAPQTTAKPTTTSTPTPTVSPTKAPIKHTATEKYVVIDPGHGGSDPGALGTLNEKEVRESDLTLSISKKVKKILEQNGYTVYMTRSTDVYKTLVERPTYANNLDAAVFVSIHINSATTAEAVGTEVYYAESNNDDSYGTTSSKLAKNILNEMIDEMGSVNRGVRTAEHAVTKRTNMPSSLVEVGFISNESELEKMISEEYQQKTAKGIANGILKTLKDIDVFD